MATIPETQGRLVTSVNLKTSVLQTSGLSDTTSLPVTTSGTALIGVSVIGSLLDATSRLTVKQTRQNHRIYSLGSAAFEPNLVVPGPITTDLELTRVVLYARDFFEALGFTQGTLSTQIVPFLIDVELRAPTGAVRTIRFNDCWLNGHTLPFDVSGNETLIVQSLAITAGRVETHDAVFGGIGFFTNKIASNIHIPNSF